MGAAQPKPAPVSLASSLALLKPLLAIVALLTLMLAG